MSACLARTATGMAVRNMRTMRNMTNQAANTKCCQANQVGQVDKVVSELKSMNFGITCLTVTISAIVIMLSYIHSALLQIERKA